MKSRRRKGEGPEVGKDTLILHSLITKSQSPNQGVEVEALMTLEVQDKENKK